MADDCSTFPDPLSDALVSQLKQESGDLWARCDAPGCGVMSRIDRRAWPAAQGGRLPLGALETRLRCSCGARSARLSTQMPTGDIRRGIIYPFS